MISVTPDGAASALRRRQDTGERHPDLSRLLHTGDVLTIGPLELEVHWRLPPGPTPNSSAIVPRPKLASLNGADFRPRRSRPPRSRITGMTPPQDQPFASPSPPTLHFGTRHTAGHRATIDLVARLEEQPPDVCSWPAISAPATISSAVWHCSTARRAEKPRCPATTTSGSARDDARGDSLDLYDRICQPSAAITASLISIRSRCCLPDSRPGHRRLHQLVRLHLGQRSACEQPPDDWQNAWRASASAAACTTTPTSSAGRSTTRPLRIASSTTHRRSRCRNRTSKNAIVVVHHPPVRGLLYPAEEPLAMDALLWRSILRQHAAGSGIDEALEPHPLRLLRPHALGRECELDGMRGINIGGDYHFKRLVWVDWPSGIVREEEFQG